MWPKPVVWSVFAFTDKVAPDAEFVTLAVKRLVTEKECPPYTEARYWPDDDMVLLRQFCAAADKLGVTALMGACDAEASR